MTEETLFNTTVKVITRRYGISNAGNAAGIDYATDPLAPESARIILLKNSRFVTTGNVTFLVGKPAISWRGAEFDVAVDTDMKIDGLEFAEVWIACGEIISIIEEA
jgi:hypothetical protein